VKASSIERLKRELLRSDTCRQQIIEVLMENVLDTLKVFDFGHQKHPDAGDEPNFLLPDGNKCSKHERGSSILRHAAHTFMQPEILDEESGLPEMLHLLSSVCIMYIRHKRNIIHSEDKGS